MSVIGHFDQQGNACLKFHLRGVAHADPGLEFTGIIDTGFTGFLQLPMQHAFALKLPLDGTANVTLADGSSTVCLTALGRTTFDGETMVGLVSLEPQSQDILVGMDFLRKFKKSVIIAKSSVVLLEEDWLDTAIAAAQAQAPQAEVAQADAVRAEAVQAEASAAQAAAQAPQAHPAAPPANGDGANVTA